MWHGYKKSFIKDKSLVLVEEGEYGTILGQLYTFEIIIQKVC